MRSDPWRQRRFSDILQMSWRLGSFMGVSVSVHVLTVLVPLLMWMSNPLRMGLSGSLVFAVYFTLLLYAIVFVHEMGHILTARRYKIGSDRITLSPMGGVAHLQSPGPTPVADIVISAGGPVTHLPWIALFWVFRYVLPIDLIVVNGYPWSFVLADVGLWMNIGMLIFNLLPIYPLDGGRILEGFLEMRMSRYRATTVACRVGQVGGGLMMIYGIMNLGGGSPWGMITLMIGLNCIMICTKTITFARMGGLPTYEAREPWQASDESWRSGSGIFGDDSPSGTKTSARSKRKVERDRKAHNRAIEQQEEDAKELDRILEKIHKEGMPSLTPKERKFLKRTSDSKRS